MYTEHQVQLFYYFSMGLVIIAAVIMFTMQIVGNKQIKLVDDWQEDRMVVQMTFNGQDFSPIFKNKKGEIASYHEISSDKYHTYEINTSDYSNGTWYLVYPKIAKNFSYQIY